MESREDIVRLVQALYVREAQDVEAPVEEKGIAPPVVVDLVAMLAAVDFDDEVCLEAGEVADVGSDAMLAAELEPSHLPVA